MTNVRSVPEAGKLRKNQVTVSEEESGSSRTMQVEDVSGVSLIISLKKVKSQRNVSIDVLERMSYSGELSKMQKAILQGQPSI
jgi:hypothetical protein